MASKNLDAAKRAKNDEFYTLYFDVEREMEHYVSHFRGKVIYCNCDNPEWSNFWIYFRENFNELGIKLLISTHFESSKATYKKTFDGVEEKIERLLGNGDFRSPECVEILKNSDIIVSNPPFSLFREYILQILENGKEFIVLGNMNALTYKEFFPHFQNGKAWVGYHNDEKTYEVPFDYESDDCFERDGKKYTKIRNTIWFTNLEIPKRHEFAQLSERYSPEKYPKYDNYDAIEVSRYPDIPTDYGGVMGVPISFMDKFCPEQFEIVGFRKGKDGKDLKVDGKTKYCRILIQRR